MHHLQGSCHLGDSCSYLHIQPGQPFSLAAPTFSPYYPPSYAQPFPRVTTAHPIDMYAQSDTIAPHIHGHPGYENGLPYAPPTTPISCVSNQYSPVSMHSPLVTPSASPELSKRESGCPKTEERTRTRHRSGSRGSTDAWSCYYRSEYRYLYY